MAILDTSFLDFLGQIWTQRTFRYILGLILVIFENVTFGWFQGHLSTFQKWVVSENQSFLDEGVIVTPLLV